MFPHYHSPNDNWSPFDAAMTKKLSGLLFGPSCMMWTRHRSFAIAVTKI